MKTNTHNAEPTASSSPALFDPEHPRQYPWSSLAWLPQPIKDDVFWASHYYRDVKPETARFLAAHGISDVNW